MAGVKQAPKLQLTQVHQLVGFGPRPRKIWYKYGICKYITHMDTHGVIMCTVIGFDPHRYGKVISQKSLKTLTEIHLGHVRRDSGPHIPIPVP